MDYLKYVEQSTVVPSLWLFPPFGSHVFKKRSEQNIAMTSNLDCILLLEPHLNGLNLLIELCDIFTCQCIKSRVSTVEYQEQSINSRISRVEYQEQSLKSIVSRVEYQEQSLKSRVSRVESQEQSIKSRVSRVEHQEWSIKSRISIVESQEQSLKSRVSRVESQEQSIKSRVSRVEYQALTTIKVSLLFKYHVLFNPVSYTFQLGDGCIVLYVYTLLVYQHTINPISKVRSDVLFQ